MVGPFSIHVAPLTPDGYTVTVCPSDHSTDAMNTRSGVNICEYADTKMSTMQCDDEIDALHEVEKICALLLERS